MYSKLVLPGFIKSTMGRKSVTKQTLLVQESGKSNRCVIFPANNVSMVAKTMERRDHDWYFLLLHIFLIYVL